MIETRNLGYNYSHRRKILDSITLSLPKGHIYGLLGKNGVGKSTLMKVLCGALCGKGEYTLNGFDPRKRQIPFLQSFRLIPEEEPVINMKISELARVTAPLYPTFSFELFNKALDELEVPADQRMTTMSLGQHKKASIALGLACNTPFIFLDEPTNGMDIPSKGVFRRLVDSMRNEERTIIISTHQVDDLENLIDAIVILENHGLLLSETLDEISDRLHFGPSVEGEEAIYQEETLRGKWSITLNTDGTRTPVDAKLLFNAVTVHPDKFRQIFDNIVGSGK